jgi:hypothetical protein
MIEDKRLYEKFKKFMVKVKEKRQVRTKLENAPFIEKGKIAIAYREELKDKIQPEQTI